MHHNIPATASVKTVLLLNFYNLSTALLVLSWIQIILDFIKGFLNVFTECAPMVIFESISRFDESVIIL